MMTYFIIAGATIVWAINYMYLSGSGRMDVDFDSEISEILLISFLSLIGIPFIFPGLLFVGIIKCIFRMLDFIRDYSCGKWDEFVNWIRMSQCEKKEAKKKKKFEAERTEKRKKDNIIKELKEEILSLNARIKELNRYKREDIIDI